MDLVGMNAAGPNAKTWGLAELQAAAQDSVYASLRPILRLGLQNGGGALTDVQAQIEAWYNSAMDRVSGWYKRRTQAVLFVASMLLVVGLNVNTVTVVQALKQSSTLRQTVVAQAQAQIKAHPDGLAVGPTPDRSLGAVLSAYQTTVAPIGLPIGWNAGAEAMIDPALKAAWARGTGAAWAAAFVPALQLALGWLMTALALTLGAPFWFDVLNKLVQLRSALKPPPKAKAT
jgi:hypothetical protein